MYRYIFDNHELRCRINPNSNVDYHTYNYYLLCLIPGSSTRTQELDFYSKFKEEYRFCPYCGQKISEGIKYFFSNKDFEKYVNENFMEVKKNAL